MDYPEQIPSGIIARMGDLTTAEVEYFSLLISQFDIGVEQWEGNGYCIAREPGRAGRSGVVSRELIY